MTDGVESFQLASGHSLDAILNEVRTVTSSKTLFGGDLRAVADLLAETAHKLGGKDVKEVCSEQS